MSASPPANPAGEFKLVPDYSYSVRTTLTSAIADAPNRLKSATNGLSTSQLDTPYKNWTVRQITHHLADSHLHSIIRFKWTLTEDHPTIKAYEEADWVELDDCKQGDIEPALAMYEGLHMKWVQLLQSMSADQFSRTFLHPQSGESVSLWFAINYYAWHGRHHVAQIDWLRTQNGW